MDSELANDLNREFFSIILEPRVNELLKDRKRDDFSMKLVVEVSELLRDRNREFFSASPDATPREPVRNLPTLFA